MMYIAHLMKAKRLSYSGHETSILELASKELHPPKPANRHGGEFLAKKRLLLARSLSPKTFVKLH